VEDHVRRHVVLLREALLGIAGVGQAKLERYGEDFLSVLRGPT
jgi:superfamily II DNA helicase RecQ